MPDRRKKEFDLMKKTQFITIITETYWLIQVLIQDLDATFGKLKTSDKDRKIKPLKSFTYF